MHLSGQLSNLRHELRLLFDAMQIATSVRRYKSEQNISLGSELTLLQLGVANSGLGKRLAEASSDLMSITRAKTVEIVETLSHETKPLPFERADITIGIA